MLPFDNFTRRRLIGDVVGSECIPNAVRQELLNQNSQILPRALEWAALAQKRRLLATPVRGRQALPRQRGDVVQPENRRAYWTGRHDAHDRALTFDPGVQRQAISVLYRK